MTPRPYGPSTVNRNRRTRAQLDAVDAAIFTAVFGEHPATLRGIFYRVVSAGAVDKTEAGYRLVGREVLKLRRSGALPYSWVTDGTRWITRPHTWGGIDQMLADAAVSYRRQLWHDQAVEVQVFTEKDAISGVILPVTDLWDVPLGVLRGFASESFAYTVAAELKAADKPVYLYQLGDHDPSGVDAWRDFSAKVTGFAPDAELHFQRIAVTPEQITAWSLPTRPTKTTDTRAAGFSGESVEVDAIAPNRLRNLVEHAISQHVDEPALRAVEAAEASERAIFAELIGGAR